MKRRLDPIELSFLALDSNTTSQVISIICLLEKAIPEKLFREKFELILPHYQGLRHILKSQDWVFKKNFNPQNNIIFKKINQDLITFCQEEYSKKLDNELPPWKIVVISGKANAIHFIFHHSLVDGMGIMELINDLAEVNSTLTIQNKTNKKIFSHKLEALKLILGDLSKASCTSPINGINSNSRNISILDLSLKEINFARKHYRVSMHQYMLGLVTNALERYFKTKDYKQNKISILTPVSHRQPKASQKLGNFITGMAIELNLTHNSNKSRLNEVKYKFEEKISGKKNEIYIYLANIVAKLPEKLRKVLCNFSAKKTHLICTSVPAKEEITICECKITGIYGTAALMKGHGISIAFSRYLDKMCICLINDPNIVNDPKMITNFILNSHQDFFREASNA